MPPRSRSLAVASALVLGAAATGCGDDAPAQYSDETRADVLAGCVSELDPAIVGDVCACTYRLIRIELPYERFRAVDRQLRLEPASTLPDDVLELLGRCVIEVGDL